MSIQELLYLQDGGYLLILPEEKVAALAQRALSARDRGSCIGMERQEAIAEYLAHAFDGWSQSRPAYFEARWELEESLDKRPLSDVRHFRLWYRILNVVMFGRISRELQRKLQRWEREYEPLKEKAALASRKFFSWEEILFDYHCIAPTSAGVLVELRTKAFEDYGHGDELYRVVADAYC